MPEKVSIILIWSKELASWGQEVVEDDCRHQMAPGYKALGKLGTQ